MAVVGPQVGDAHRWQPFVEHHVLPAAFTRRRGGDQGLQRRRQRAVRHSRHRLGGVPLAGGGGNPACEGPAGLGCVQVVLGLLEAGHRPVQVMVAAPLGEALSDGVVAAAEQGAADRVAHHHHQDQQECPNPAAQQPPAPLRRPPGGRALTGLPADGPLHCAWHGSPIDELPLFDVVMRSAPGRHPLSRFSWASPCPEPHRRGRRSCPLPRMAAPPRLGPPGSARRHRRPARHRLAVGVGGELRRNAR